MLAEYHNRFSSFSMPLVSCSPWCLPLSLTHCWQRVLMVIKFQLHRLSSPFTNSTPHSNSATLIRLPLFELQRGFYLGAATTPPTPLTLVSGARVVLADNDSAFLNDDA